MPDGALYWYGYKPYTIAQHKESTNASYCNITENAQSITMLSVHVGNAVYNAFVVFNTTIASGNTYIKAIMTGSAVPEAIYMGTSTAYPPAGNTVYAGATRQDAPALGLKTHTITSSNTGKYPEFCVSGGTVNLTAMWLE